MIAALGLSIRSALTARGPAARVVQAQDGSWQVEKFAAVDQHVAQVRESFLMSFGEGERFRVMARAACMVMPSSRALSCADGAHLELPGKPRALLP